ncbi:uncharacterized protein LOC121873667 isoform X2 [Homarus americanus]|uniref:uncharacterized protein LOC121873667 isoform X2 n=1 Tax=Homarus americanus TaxID=6706 RepID=UPI001C492659|nr:uncharacterized protein LOC121873667 isoform X2 [Homarus americanus]
MMGVRFQGFLVLLLCNYVAGEMCPDEEEIACMNQDKCIPLRYICDEDDDCNDDNDEDDELCQAWSNDDCERGSAMCQRLGNSFCTSIVSYCDYQDPPCEGNLDPRICVMIKNNTVAPLHTIRPPLSNKKSNLNDSLELADEFNAVSWGEAQAFCQVLGGDLITFKNISHYAAVVSHLRNSQMTADFWVGGRMVDESQGWTWIDSVPMELGSPFWAVRYIEECKTRNVTYPELNITREANVGTCYSYQQAPQEHPVGNCVAASYEHYYYMIDSDCLEKKSPLCVYADDDYPDEQ